MSKTAGLERRPADRERAPLQHHRSGIEHPLRHGVPLDESAQNTNPRRGL